MNRIHSRIGLPLDSLAYALRAGTGVDRSSLNGFKFRISCFPRSRSSKLDVLRKCGTFAAAGATALFTPCEGGIWGSSAETGQAPPSRGACPVSIGNRRTAVCQRPGQKVGQRRLRLLDRAVCRARAPVSVITAPARTGSSAGVLSGTCCSAATGAAAGASGAASPAWPGSGRRRPQRCGVRGDRDQVERPHRSLARDEVPAQRRGRKIEWRERLFLLEDPWRRGSPVDRRRTVERLRRQYRARRRRHEGRGGRDAGLGAKAGRVVHQHRARRGAQTQLVLRVQHHHRLGRIEERREREGDDDHRARCRRGGGGARRRCLIRPRRARRRGRARVGAGGVEIPEAGIPIVIGVKTMSWGVADPVAAGTETAALARVTPSTLVVAARGVGQGWHEVGDVRAPEAGDEIVTRTGSVLGDDLPVPAGEDAVPSRDVGEIGAVGPARAGAHADGVDGVEELRCRRGSRSWALSGVLRPGEARSHRRRSRPIAASRRWCRRASPSRKPRSGWIRTGRSPWTR